MYQTRIRNISTQATELENRIIENGCTVRDIAELIELTQQSIDVLDDMLTNPPPITAGKLSEENVERILEFMR